MPNPRSCNQKLYDTWEKRWEGSQERERLTLLGRSMFRAKRKALNQVLQELSILTVMEVGCGLGHTMSVYQDRGLTCVGIDVAPSAVDQCRRKGLRARLLKVEEVRETYDLVSCDGMLEHFLHFEPYARHLMRISRRYVLLIQPNYDSFTGKTLAYLDTLLRPRENVYEYNYRIEDFVGTFEGNGFRIAKNVPLFFDVFRILLFERPESCSPEMIPPPE